MREWALQDAKARLSEVVRLALEHEPQEITLRGEPAVVVLSREDYDHLTKPRESLVEFMRRSPLYAIMPLFFLVGGMRRARRLARAGRYDLVHVHWPMPMALLGWAARRAHPMPMVTTFYGIELRWVQSRLPFLRWLVRWAARWGMATRPTWRC